MVSVAPCTVVTLMDALPVFLAVILPVEVTETTALFEELQLFIVSFEDRPKVPSWMTLDFTRYPFVDRGVGDAMQTLILVAYVDAGMRDTARKITAVATSKTHFRIDAISRSSPT